MRLLEQYDIYSNETDHARCPYLTRLADGRLLLGMNILHNLPRLRYDWDPGQKPHYILAETPEKLVRKQPTLLSDCHGLPPMFFQCNDGSILATYNSWTSHLLGTPEADAVLADPELANDVKVRQDVTTAADKGGGLNFDQRAELIGWDPIESGEIEHVGVLNPITILRSTDGAETWEDWGRVWGDPDRQRFGAAFRGNMVQLDSGEILFMTSARPSDGSSATLRCSSDGGRTWPIRSRLFVPDNPEERISESHVYHQPTGRVTVVSRTGKSKYLAVGHSDDEGRTWSDGPRLTTVWGYPPHVMLHSSGRALLTYYRRSFEPKGLFAKVLAPDLSDIDEAEQYCISDSSGKGRGGGGYPSAVELEDGSVLVTWYDRSEPFGPSRILGQRLMLD